MTVTVTGAVGFVGSNVVRQLVSCGHSPTLAVRPGSKIPAEFSGLPIVELDLAGDTSDVFVKLGEPDVVVHLAWNGLENYGSLDHFEVELPNHYAFLSGLVESGLQRLVVTGTCFEYGMSAGPLDETVVGVPSSPYSFAKNALRHQLEFLGKSQPFELTWARLFYLFGPGQERSLFAQLSAAVERGDESFDMSQGEQIRDYQHVADAAADLANLALSEQGCGIVNVCSGNPVSVRRLVEDIIVTNDWNIEMNLGAFPYSPHEPFAFWGDRSKLNAFLEQTK